MAQGHQLEVIRPKTKDHLEAKGHHVAEGGQRLCCHMCGQEWATGRQGVEGNCPGPTLWGYPQINKPWLVPTGQ
eukprot:2609433-Karenia_brevis.AAC.1